MTLDRLMSPRSIAVIGGRECERVIEQCDRMGFDGTIWPVHPKREQMGRRACFASLADLPSAPDAAYIAVNRERTIDVVRGLNDAGCGGAICYASGWAEAEDEGAIGLQEKLVEAAGDMPIVGPNCYGFINAATGAALWPDQHGLIRTEKGVAIIGQSSNVAINFTLQARGLPIAFMQTVGNQAQTGLSNLAEALLRNPNITALGLHIEGLDDVAAFERVSLLARDLGKPIIALKVGRSDAAQAAALTHTASLAGSDTAHTALFKRLGVGRVETLEGFLAALMIAHQGGPLAGNSIASLSCSGGEAGLMADAAEGRAIEWRPFANQARTRLKDILGPIVTIANPLDYHTFIWGDWPAMQAMYEAALSDGHDALVLVIDIPRTDRCDPADWLGALAAFRKAVAETDTRAIVVTSLAETLPETLARDLLAEGIPAISGLQTALEAIGALAQIGRVWSRPQPQTLLKRPDAWTGESRTLDEHEAKRELAAHGLVVPKHVVFTSDVDAREALSLRPPFALKALGIAHKTEAGGVILNLKTEQDVADALPALAPLSNRFLLEEMAAKPTAEILVGITRDPVIGLVMTMGAGGVLTELLADTATLLLPASEADIREALAGLKISRLLDGYRGEDAADIDALVANTWCIARYAVDHADELIELDVNPLFATPFGSVAVDALIVKRTFP